ncbi:RNA recognition domain-containing protein [Ceratocystis lukuohia]|uniref:RNA recognition domain-containing protein n=1 Tax=Ceratocystis lukuohia TaxID=2019550 RepID=A0ABR4MIZ9_9PEZI
MNKIRAIQALNQKEIENGISPNASWHVDYRDTAFVYFGGLPLELSEGDIITIFSQFGEPVFIKLARDKETGKSRGFGWLKYEDQRSTDLAVDNLGGATIGSRMISVDHARYKFRDDEDPDEGKIDWETMQRQAGQSADTDLSETGSEDEDGTDTEGRRHRPMLKEEKELALLIQEHDDEDPMKEFLIEEKKKEIEEALALQKSNGGRSDRDKERRHKRHKSSRRDGNDGRSTRDKDRDKDRDRKSKRDREPARDSHRSRRDADGDVDMDSNYKRSEREKRMTKSAIDILAQAIKPLGIAGLREIEVEIGSKTPAMSVQVAKKTSLSATAMTGIPIKIGIGIGRHGEEQIPNETVTVMQ